mgnify:CR=1 FL=1
MIRPSFALLLVCVGVGVSVACAACARPEPRKPEVVRVGRVVAPPMVVEEADAGPPPAPPFCMDATLREAHLADAWPEGERVVYCVAMAGDEFEKPIPRTCASVGKRGDYRSEPTRHGTAPALPIVPLRSTSADGNLTFRLQGGLREPKKATGILEQKSPKRILKKAPVEYDEHIAFVGWIGDHVVVRTWVDEGPGCQWNMVNPKTTWPSGVDYEHSQSLGGCYGGNFTLKPRADEYAIVDAGGGSVTFVSESTLEVSPVETERQAGPEMGLSIVPWMDGDELVMVYGAPISGDVARVNLKTKRVSGVFTPAACPEKPKK